MNSRSDEYSFFYRNCIICPLIYEPIVNYLKKLLKENNFEYKEYKEGNEIILILSQNNEEKFLREAQFIKLRKKYNKPGNNQNPNCHQDISLPAELIKHEERKNFLYRDKSNYFPDESFHKLYKTKKNDETWGLGLFTDYEMLTLEYMLLKNIEIDESLFLDAINGTLLQKKLEEIQNYMSHEKSVIHILHEFHVIKDIFPLHISDMKNNILKEGFLSNKFPYNDVRNYYGDKVAMYYAWVNHYTTSLIIPSIFSIFTIIMVNLFSDKSKFFFTLYAVLLSIWTQLYVIFWKRRCSEIVIEWDNFTENYNLANIRREFKGKWTRSWVTGNLEKTYPSIKRVISYFYSFIISIPYVVIALSLNILFLNLYGLANHDTIFEIQFIGKLIRAGPDQIINTENFYYPLIIGVVHSNVVFKINVLFSYIAIDTCEKENHKYKSNYENSLIIKRFSFEFLNEFFLPFYLAFINRDLNGLILLIKSHFIASEASRVLGETIIPNLKGILKGTSTFYKLFMKGDKENMKLENQISLKEVMTQIQLDDYDTFNDYLTIIIEFGYLTLFAACFPLAPIIILIVNTIEIRSDLFKLSTVFRRPRIARQKNIGSWQYIIRVISILSVFTNLLFNIMFGDSKEHLGIYHVLNFFVMEHLILAIIVLLKLSISHKPKWVKLFLERREHNMKTIFWYKNLIPKKT